MEYGEKPDLQNEVRSIYPVTSDMVLNYLSSKSFKKDLTVAAKRARSAEQGILTTIGPDGKFHTVWTKDIDAVSCSADWERLAKAKLMPVGYTHFHPLTDSLSYIPSPEEWSYW